MLTFDSFLPKPLPLVDLAWFTQTATGCLVQRAVSGNAPAFAPRLQVTWNTLVFCLSVSQSPNQLGEIVNRRAEEKQAERSLSLSPSQNHSLQALEKKMPMKRRRTLS